MSALNSARVQISPAHLPPIARSPTWPQERRINMPSLVGRRPDLSARDGVAIETSWREGPDRSQYFERHYIHVRRWRDDSGGLSEHSKGPDDRFAVLEVALRPTSLWLTIDGQSIHDGAVSPGFAAMNRAGLSSRVHVEGPCDLLHLFVPKDRFAEILGNIEDPSASASPKRAWVSLSDPVIERLAWLLLKGADHQPRSSQLYVDGMALAIVSRLLECDGAGEPGSRGLLKWRLKRVQDFIDDKLSERLSLADLARCAGLSRMHFAAQFRAATGMRPHEYLVRKRVQRAQELLLTTTVPLVQIALSVGFQTQAHFTTVFRRLLGETPGRWRQTQRLR